MFALLGVQLGGKASRSTATTRSDDSTQEFVHTPTSLFAKLRQEIIRQGLLKPIGTDETIIANIQAGDFVEFEEAVLRRSPLEAILNVFGQIIAMADTFEPSQTPSKSGGGKGRKRGASAKSQKSAAITTGEPDLLKSQRQLLQRQIEAMLQAVTTTGSLDLIAECGTMRFVLTAEEPYFIDRTMNDVIDGTFRVFGKVTRVVPRDSPSGISLLRRTALGSFGQIVGQLPSAFGDLSDIGFTGQRVETEIPAPTLQVIPIAIFA